jgi:hypothetical protein
MTTTTQTKQNKLESVLEKLNNSTDEEQKKRTISYQIKDFAETLARNHYNLIHRSGGVYEWIGGNGMYVVKTTEELFDLYINNKLD